MKTALLLFGCSMAAMANATVFTVSNEPGYPAQYTTAQAAHDVAAAGDTLYVTPSGTNYGSLSINRNLTIIGGGYGAVGANSRFNTIYCMVGSSGSRFFGLEVTSLLYPSSNGANSNILVERCRVNNVYNPSYPMDGLIVKQSVIAVVTMNTSCTNILVTNNLITQYVTGSTSPSVLISNNVFTGPNYTYALSNIQYAVISNNIFYGTSPSPDGYGVSSCAFNNNLSYQTGDNDLPATGGNVGSGNQVDVDPLFANVPALHQGLITYDYHLQAGSPGHNAGTDNTDIGLYGGSAPLNGALDGVPRLPQVTQFVLLNSSINQGGSINVQVQGSKHD